MSPPGTSTLAHICASKFEMVFNFQNRFNNVDNLNLSSCIHAPFKRCTSYQTISGLQLAGISQTNPGTIRLTLYN